MVQSISMSAFFDSEGLSLPESPMPAPAFKVPVQQDISPAQDKGADKNTAKPDLVIIRTQDPHLVQLAQRLRYQTFFGGREGSLPSGHPLAVDHDEFDQFCEHLVVRDNNRIENGEPMVVGTYRLRLSDLRTCRENNTKLYTGTEFDISKLMAGDGTVLELGRSCVHPDYRSGDVITSLWTGIGEYLATHSIDYMIGCVSFPKADISEHWQSLAYINQYHQADSLICPQALDAVRALHHEAEPVIDKAEGKAIFRQLPPLFKAYIRMGARFGEGAVLDPECDTLDLCVLVKCADIDPRYSKRFIKA